MHMQAFLPPHAVLLTYNGFPAVGTGDVDGDGQAEIACVYRYFHTSYILLLKQHRGMWYMLSHTEGKGTRLSHFGMAPVTTPSRTDLMIHWEDARSLSVYHWTPSGLQDVSRQTEHLHPAPVSTATGIKWGYINDTGQMVLKPQYEQALPFQTNGLAAVEATGRYGLIDTTGQYRVPPRYDMAPSFTEGRAVVTQNNRFYVINEQGNTLSEGYDYISMYKSGRAVYGIGDAYGYLDESGKALTKALYKRADDFVGDKAVVQLQNDTYALLGRSGVQIQPYPHAFVGMLGDGLLAFTAESGGLYGYMDENGKTVIPPQYTGAQVFAKGRAIVNTGKDFTNQYGLIDHTGRFVIQPVYESLLSLGEKRFAVGKALDPAQPFLGSRYALADQNGRFFSSFIYETIEPFQNGLASASDRTRTFFLTRNGHVHHPVLNGRGTLSQEGALIRAHIDDRLSYYRDNRLIWQQNMTISFGTLTVQQHTYKPRPDYIVYYPQIQDIPQQAMLNKILRDISQVKQPEPGEYSYSGDYEVFFYKPNLLILRLSGYTFYYGAAHGMSTMRYVHINTETGEMYALKDLFLPNSDYVKTISDIIAKQIQTDPTYSYVFPDTYKGIAPNQPFYVDEQALYVYFTPYEIGPYAAGFPTFTISFPSLTAILYKEGSFWRSFH
ncbi:WG repeat-containing protein [Ectobacillus sp. JY-23]|uniref:WG repeat-containing protein n=1 Tax=Ectobacillus sp. JY-23 TaxID=2933872 RepID=UPI001FF10895|nr:WG repeat-containing protein [Ectobacillus sp. JY-23]UOY92248.1 WG repeat-containing protein [Ectobacillus sp. JY-23]